ncbi:hypothetical protein QFC21_002708 [Naganishia friedmannii]|uniref:Uncharacterized protein n=1 Tax=Naganishia friedmannii TaxID=89922 RepID=A0ACC2VV22_9TREE|nr:hypothetical protein QFC21_002708 [Naganishia friedmannii]
MTQPSPRVSSSPGKPGTRSSQTTPTLPPKFRVPPLPPRIHRRLLLQPTDDGLVIRPSSSSPSSVQDAEDEGIVIGWGPKGAIQRLSASAAQPDDGNASSSTELLELQIGGILGVSRLWSTAYLLVFLNNPPTSTSATTSSTKPIRIFPPEEEKRCFPALPLKTPSVVEQGDPLLERLRAIAEREGILPTSPSSEARQGRDWKALLDPVGGTPQSDQQTPASNDVAREGEKKDDDLTGQGTVFELRNVYAVPLTKVGAEALIRQIQAAMAKTKSKPSEPSVPPPTTASSTSKPATPVQDDESSSLNTNAETSLEAFARVMNPKGWQINMPKFAVPQPKSSTATQPATPDVSEGIASEEPERVVERSVPRPQEGASESGALMPSESGDLGETPLAHLQEESSTAGAVHQKQDKNDPKDPNPEDGVSDAETVMAAVPGTQTQQESTAMGREKKRESFMGVEWGKVFGKGSLVRQKSSRGDATPSGAEALEAKIPGILDDLTDEERRGLEVDDGIAIESSIASLDGKAPGPEAGSQRKDLEAKIVREMVRELGNGGFFYSFETDLSHSLQHKRRQLSARTQSTGLLQSLLKKEDHQDSTRSPLVLGSNESTPAEEKPRSSFPPVSGGLEAPAEIEGQEAATIDNSDTARQSRGETWVEPDVSLPLWRRMDPAFFWNAWMLRDFIDLGLHSYILPLMQGWVQSSRFYIPPAPAAPTEPAQATMTSLQPQATRKSNSIDNDLGPPSTPVDIAVISRRSKDRAGLRFQRRGIDEEGNVANFVETEMMVRVKVEGKWSIFSFTQLRGSIPLFWSQSSTLTDMKPAPVLNRPVEQSVATAKLHFDELKRRYGPQTIINLAELTGKESVVTLGYRAVCKALEDKDVRYTEFDFHNECKGMKYENISKLITQLAGTFSEQGYFWTCHGDVMREQTGTFRINCIDCLDRTNVVESALARHLLTNQLTQVGRTPDSLTSDIEWVFNDMWANNGDQISRLYAGTSALKGDFTRTGKRDLTGMLHDGLNSVTRMGRGAIGDFFSQAVISFMVGERNLTVFSEVLANLGSVDRTSLLRLSRIRAAAIETCSARVLEEGERRIYGWTLFSPDEPNVRYTQKLDEKILLISQLALYVVSFDYNLEKVVTSTRISLRNITSIQKGAYILSPLQEAGRDPEENAGFLIRFRPAKNDTRFTSYSMMNSPPVSPAKSRAKLPADKDAAENEETEFFAFKALPREFVHPGADEDEDDDRGKDETCREVVAKIVDRIQGECARAAGSVGGYVGGYARKQDFITEGDIVGLAEAQKGTSLVARADYALKRFLWIP